MAQRYSADQHHDDDGDMSFGEPSRSGIDEAAGDMSLTPSMQEEMEAEQAGIAQELGGGIAGGGGGIGVGLANGTNQSAIPDVMLLNMFCARAKAPRDPRSVDDRREAEISWEPVREWLSSHNADEVRVAAEQQGESGLTALHFACRHVPPLDIIDVLLSVAADTTVQWPDSFGWLPIHYACASGSSSEVIKALVEAYPESKTTVDRRGRTPLHFALGDKPASPDVVFLLGSSGAASYPDEIGMLVSFI
jgi:Ankyrin repeats (3 copies)